MFSRIYLQRRKMVKRRQKSSCLLENAKSSQQLPSCVIATRDSLFCKMFSPLFSFEQEKTLKNVSKKLCTSKIRKKKRKKQGQKVGWDTQILQQSSEDCYVYRSFFFSDHSIKQIDSLLPWVCSVIDHRERQNMGKTSVTHSPQPLLCFYNILTSCVIYYCTDARHNRIYLLNI